MFSMLDYISGSLLKDQEDEFARDMYSLSQLAVFDLTKFEEVIDKIRSCVAEVIKILLSFYMMRRVLCLHVNVFAFLHKT